VNEEVEVKNDPDSECPITIDIDHQWDQDRRPLPGWRVGIMGEHEMVAETLVVHEIAKTDTQAAARECAAVLRDMFLAAMKAAYQSGKEGRPCPSVMMNEAGH